MDLIEFAQRMPKAEMHIHLEGSILPRTLLKIAQRNHASLPADDEAGLSKMYEFKNFDQFLSTYMMVSKCLKTVDDYELIAYEYGEECARQNIRYAEVIFTMLNNANFSGLAWQKIMEGLNKGRQRAAGPTSSLTRAVIAFVGFPQASTPARSAEYSQARFHH